MTDSLPLEDAAPWYADGLPFTCTGCGDCCTGSPGYVWVTDADIAAIAEYLDKPIGEIRLLYSRPQRGKVSLNEYLNGDCIFLEPATRKCQIYPVRPIQCRTWPFWKSNVATPESWKRTQQTCPGCRSGELVSLETIEELIEQTDL
jgi:Fe-S-cluster containining protein